MQTKTNKKLERPASGETIIPEDDVALALKEIGPVSILAFLIIILTGNVLLPNMIILPVGGTLVLLWSWRSRTPLSELGLVRPKNWFVTIAMGIIFGVALKLVMKVIVMPLLGAPQVNQAFQFLVGNTALLPTAIWAMFVAGFAEEIVFRSFMFERFGKVFGYSPLAKISVVLLTSLWFGVSHYNLQGIPGVTQATIFGLMFGTIYMITGRIYMLMIAHTSFDLTALALIYFELEEGAARLIF